MTHKVAEILCSDQATALVECLLASIGLDGRTGAQLGCEHCLARIKRFREEEELEEKQDKEQHHDVVLDPVLINLGQETTRYEMSQYIHEPREIQEIKTY